MATKKISELNTLTTPESDDLIAIVDASATETKKITYGNISKHIVNVGTEVEEDSRVNFIHSRNLFDKNNVVVGYINADGSINSSDTNYKTSDFIRVKPNTTYYITASGTSRAKYFNSSKTPLNTSSYQDIDVGANAGSFTTPANCYYIRKSMTNARLDDLMLNKGSSALPYEPYIPNQIVVDNETFSDTLNVGTSVDGRSRVNVLKSKNLISNIDIYNGIVGGNVGSTLNYSSSIYSITYKKCCYVKANQEYTLSWKINTISASATREIHIVNNSDTILEKVSYSNANNNRTKTFKPTYSGWVYAVLDANATEVQIEQGSTATTYEPYITPSINVDGEEIYSNYFYTKSYTLTLENNSYVQPYGAYGNLAISKSEIDNYGEIISVNVNNDANAPMPSTFVRQSDGSYKIFCVSNSGNKNMTIRVVFCKFQINQI